MKSHKEMFEALLTGEVLQNDVTPVLLTLGTDGNLYIKELKWVAWKKYEYSGVNIRYPSQWQVKSESNQVYIVKAIETYNLLNYEFLCCREGHSGKDRESYIFPTLEEATKQCENLSAMYPGTIYKPEQVDIDTVPSIEVIRHGYRSLQEILNQV